ncbi:hypothetical protein DOTSEDRAFT_36605 [Dothistroma septosporum NZE10]|uniref:Uncharacterized protein n=1 Tax=Dothistroma septosporum (strain NZE10 / CBS 128990) TaxID=675120 RepID=N1PFL7_DOTSN|nr:hypothetical protein DOTSEDRAFT_36605 [Dothistroma septosporum NZE10]
MALSRKVSIRGLPQQCHSHHPTTSAQNNGKSTFRRLATTSVANTTSLIRYMTLREVATSKAMTVGADAAFRKEILEAAKQIALSACIMDGPDSARAAELAHAAWSVVFIPGVTFESEKEVEQASAILELASGILSEAAEGDGDLDEDEEWDPNVVSNELGKYHQS